MAENWKEAKKERKHEKKVLKRERKSSKKHRKLEKKMTKVQRKLGKKEARLSKALGSSESAEFEPVTDVEGEDVPEFEVVSEDVTVVEQEIEIPDLPVDTSRIPEIERKMDYLMGGESGVQRKFKEKYGETLGTPVAPKVKVGKPKSMTVPDVPETTPDTEPVVETVEEVPAEEPKKKKGKKKKKKGKKKKAPKAEPEEIEPVGFFEIKKWKFLQSRKPPSNIILQLILTLIDLVLWIIRIIIWIPVTILKTIFGLIRRGGDDDDEDEE